MPWDDGMEDELDPRPQRLRKPFKKENKAAQYAGAAFAIFLVVALCALLAGLVVWIWMMIL